MKNVIGKFSIGFFLLLAVLVCSNSFSTSDEVSNPISVSTRVTPETFTLGDIATYTITIQHDPDIRPVAPEIVPPEGLEFIEQGVNPPVNGQTVHEYWYKLRVDDTGKLTIPATQVTFEAPDQKGKSVQGTILAPEVSFEVQSLLSIPGSPEGIHDIKPLEEYPLPWLDYLWMALAGLALIALLYLLWRKWKSRPVSLNIPAPALTPEQLALKELEALKNKEWLQIGRTQEHFFELSEIFRRYLENRYQFPAREWTTEEITAHFKSFPSLSDNQKLKARSILTQTDRVKFAKAEQAVDEMQSIINFIQEATPPEPEV
ncbi:MAG: protein BatD, partial [Nitrospinae bacterium]|nr:protein BatD [Nitrospinota bacterium]